MTSSLGHSIDTIRQICERRGFIRAKDLDETGVSRAWLERHVGFGWIDKVDRGLYVLPGVRLPPMALAAARFPAAIVCLRSALFFHGLLATEPAKLWLAVSRKARLPSLEGATFVRSEGRLLELKVEHHRVLNVPVRITTVAKAVVDCFRFRSRVGQELGPEMLDKAIATGRCTPLEVLTLAKVCRSWHLMSQRMCSTPPPPR